VPLYEYRCLKCGFVFEELKTSAEGSEATNCVDCGARAEKMISSFSAIVAGGSPNETADMWIGRDADKKWQKYHDGQSKRHKDKIKEVPLPKDKDGKYMPIMGLGGKNDRSTRQDYVGALQSHRKERTDKGRAQFDSKGGF